MEELTKQSPDTESGADQETTNGADTETTDLDRRRFFGGLATVLGTAAVIGLRAEGDTAEAKEIKSKILSRIQEQLNREIGPGGGIGLSYTKAIHSRYLKAPPVEPIIVGPI